MLDPSLMSLESLVQAVRYARVQIRRFEELERRRPNQAGYAQRQRERAELRLAEVQAELDRHR